MFILMFTIHVLAAVVGIGPAFMYSAVTGTAKNRQQLVHAHQLLLKMNRYLAISALLLFLSGSVMMFVGKFNHAAMWLNVSIVLFLIFVVIAVIILPKRIKATAEMLAAASGDDIPPQYRDMKKKMAPLLGTMHLLLMIILILMIAKPF